MHGKFAAVLLAAGESRRMQGLDKRRLRIGDQALISRWPALLRCAGIDDLVVVLGDDAARITTLLEDARAVLVRHTDWNQGQASSVLAGLRAVPPDAQAVLILLCDLPLIDALDLRALQQAFDARAPGVEVLVPVHHGVRGNPVVVARAAIDAVLAEPSGEGLRRWIDRHPERVLRWPVDNDHYTFDIDTRDDITRLESRLGVPVRIDDAIRG